MTHNGAALIIYCIIGASFVASIFVIAAPMLSSRISRAEEARECEG